jgi:hypothetical protein
VRYFLQFGTVPDLDNPETYNEKIQHFKLYGASETVRKCCDKYRVREYVNERIDEDILPDLYWHGENPEDIPFDDLPESFVMKCNHGCGYNILVDDKDELNEAEAISRLKMWLREDFWRRGRELNYKGIDKQVIVEEYLKGADGNPPRDIKVFVMGGKVEFIQIDVDRFGDHKRALFTPEWKQLPFTILYPMPDREIAPPERLDDILSYAENLANGFDLVRVDFYEESGNVYFGEMTFTPGAGLRRFRPDHEKYDRIYGDRISNNKDE